jgi:hypothetical protein
MMGMRTGNTMGDAYLGKEGIKFFMPPNHSAWQGSYDERGAQHGLGILEVSTKLHIYV